MAHRGRNPLRRGLWIGTIPMVVYFIGMFVFPLVYIIINSFMKADINGMAVFGTFTFENYVNFLGKGYNIIALGRTFAISVISVTVGILLAVPIAYTIVFHLKGKFQMCALLIVILPFWTSFIIRAFSWQLLLSDSGPLCSILTKLGLADGSLNILFTHKATVLALGLYSMMTVLLNTYSVMSGIDKSLLEAVSDLGGGKWKQFTEVIFPLSLPGIVLGGILSFIVCIGDYIAPTLLGGGIKTVLSQLMMQSLKTSFHIPNASTYSVIMLLMIIVMVVPLLKYIKRGATGK